MAKATTADVILSWLTRVCSVERPASSVIAYNIGLYETRQGFTAYLIGAPTFDEHNGDWACRGTFRPRERDCRLPRREHPDWEHALNAVVEAVRMFLALPVGQESFLGQATAVTVGFDDGDLQRVH